MPILVAGVGDFKLKLLSPSIRAGRLQGTEDTHCRHFEPRLQNSMLSQDEVVQLLLCLIVVTMLMLAGRARAETISRSDNSGIALGKAGNPFNPQGDDKKRGWLRSARMTPIENAQALERPGRVSGSRKYPL